MTNISTYFAAMDMSCLFKNSNFSSSSLTDIAVILRNMSNLTHFATLYINALAHVSCQIKTSSATAGKVLFVNPNKICRMET